MARQFLYLTNSRLVSLATRGKRIVGRTEFPVEAGPDEAFEKHVRALRDTPTHLVTDLAEEDFRLDTIPHVGSRDREALLSRRLSQLFRATPFRHAVVLGRESEGRRDDRVLYTAIVNPEVLQPWLECLARLRVPLAGIHSAATFSGRILTELALEFPHTLLVMFTPGSAIRQTYFRNREVRFSRLTPIDLEEGSHLGELLNDEITRTWQYLDSVRSFAEHDHLEVCVLVHPKDRPAVEPYLRDAGQIHYRVLDIEQAALQLGMKPPPLTSSAEGILTHVFLRKPAPNDYASGDQRRSASLRTGRRVLGSLSAALLAGGVAWGTFVLYKTVQTEGGEREASSKLAAVNKEYESIKQALPTHGVGGVAMRETVGFYNANLRDHPTVAGFLLPITRALDGQSAIRILQFAWQTAADPNVMPNLPVSGVRQAPAIRAQRRNPDPVPSAAAESADAGIANRRHQVALLEATVQVQGTKYREALGHVEKLVQSISAIPGYRAEIVESPLDTRPLAAIQGRFDEREETAAEARFTVRIIRAAKAPA